MSAIEASPFFKENLIAQLKIEESLNWVDQVRIVEANRTFKGEVKRYCFAQPHHPHVDYRQMRADREFTTRTWHPKRRFPFLGKRAFSWVNEGRQRDFLLRGLEVEDDDILIFSDIDEILDSRDADRIIGETLKRQIVTVGLYVNVYYLNAFDFNLVGPPNFSYRVFVMTGKFLRGMGYGIDKLRKLGESGSLFNSVYRIPGYSGFHLSWIGDDEFVESKMKAYAHEPEHFQGDIYREDGSVNADAIKDSMRKLHHPMSPNQVLEVRDDIPLLTSVARHRDDVLAPYFL